MDVTPLSLGIELIGGKMSVLISRNTTIPYSHTKTYYNNEDNQEFANIILYEGEEAFTARNRLLGEFKITNLPRRKRGEVPIEVTFSINQNGILEVSAQVKEAGLSLNIKIDQNKGLLSQEQIYSMTEKAKQFEKLDKTNEEIGKALNQLELNANKLKKEIQRFQPTNTDLQTFADETLIWIKNNKSAPLETIVEKNKKIEDILKNIVQTLI